MRSLFWSGILLLFLMPFSKAGFLDCTGMNQLVANFDSTQVVRINLPGYGIIEFMLPEKELTEFAYHSGKELLELEEQQAMEYNYKEFNAN